MPLAWLERRRANQEQSAYWYLDMQRKRNTGIRYDQREWELFSKKHLKDALGITFFGLKTRQQKAVEEYLKLKRHEIFMNGPQFNELRANNLSSRLETHPRLNNVDPKLREAIKDTVIGGNELRKISKDANGFKVEFKNAVEVVAYGMPEVRELAKLFSNKISRNEPEKTSLTAKELGLEEDIEGYILKKYGMKTKMKKIPYTVYERGLQKKLQQITAFKPAFQT